MDEGDADQTGTPPPPPAPPRSAGETLRAAREAQGLTLADIGARTRVPLRHLEAIETGDYQSLPSPTYAVGFGRAYARAVGVDDVGIAQGVRVEVDRLGRRQPEYEPYEVADPSRVPSRGLAIVAAGLALGLVVLAALWFGGAWMQRSPEPQASPVVATRPVPAPTRAVAATGGEVVLTAQDEVWLRVYDAADKTLYIGTMKPGERYIVPADAADPKINVGRPDKLAVTLNGAAAPPLGTGERPIKDVAVSGAAIAARLAGATAAAPAPSASPTPVAGPADGGLPPAFASPQSAPSRPSAPPRPRSALTETQRANLDAARNLQAPAASER